MLNIQLIILDWWYCSKWHHELQEAFLLAVEKSRNRARAVRLFKKSGAFVLAWEHLMYSDDLDEVAQDLQAQGYSRDEALIEAKDLFYAAFEEWIDA